jgi:SM-20-related protein
MISTTHLIAKYDLLLAPQFLDEATCNKIIEETHGASHAPATVYGRNDSGSVDERTRRTTRLTVLKSTIDSITGLLLQYKPEVERHFAVVLNGCEDPQFLRYELGDFFVAHQDGNTGLIQLGTDADRKISVVIFLNGQTTKPIARGYCGGSLKFSDYRAEPGYREFELSGEPGLLVAFRAETTHEVTPVTAGERYSIVSWYV